MHQGTILLKLMSPFPELRSFHTTYTLLPSATICGKRELPGLLLRFITSPKLVPLSVLFLRNTSAFPGVESCHTTYILLSSIAAIGSLECPALLLKFESNELIACSEDSDGDKIAAVLKR